MTKVVLATRNQGKVRELQAMLEGQDIEVVGLDQFPEIGEIEETGTTFEENARLKASAVSEATGLIALADDSGLCVDALDRAPGVWSARYAGEGATDQANNEKLLAVMENVPDDKRACNFISCIVAHAPDGHELVFHGVWFGRVARAPQGENGFGYDPLFYDPELKLTAAQMSAEQKNARSHRGRAVKELVKYFPGFVEKVAREAVMGPEDKKFRDSYQGVKGVLKLFCLIMLIAAPVYAATVVSGNLKLIEAINGPQGPGADVAAELSKAMTAQNVLVMIAGFWLFWAGLTLYRRKRGAVRFAKMAWIFVPVAEAAQYGANTLFALPPDTLAMAQRLVLANTLYGVVLAAAAVGYLTFSKQVKATYLMDRG